MIYIIYYILYKTHTYKTYLYVFIYIHTHVCGFFIVVLFCFCLFRAAPTAHGSSQAKGKIGAVDTDLHHSHSNAGPEPHLQLHHSSRQHQILNPLNEARD